MREELGLEPVEDKETIRSSITVFGSAMVGSLIPLFPFFLLPVANAIVFSLLLSAGTLFLVGVYKARVTVGRPVRSGIELLVIGMLAALIGYVIGLLFKAPITP